ncbi:NAD(P)-dependent oxidoreductase [Nocardia iowensis]|uniref:Alanine dehydrogenase n=1 Tax=Nocardia iowensis TaxID=204891 RepID=A0ABX8RFB2_NOCIO|nr:NAD(P)-dependent oxidoreductase [Nocardia iowensis]QXN88298.1 hypothetical protein KV110_22090 [Nocardia iowensis]
MNPHQRRSGTPIGFPIDRTDNNRPILLTPALADQLTGAGFTVLTEPGIGARFGISDDEYATHRVSFADAATVWSCPLLMKYKAFEPAEIRMLRTDQTVAAVFHAEGRPDITSALLESGVRAYSYEFLHEDNQFPMMRAGGRIAGIQSVLYAAHYLQTSEGGRGVLLADVPGCPVPRVLVIGSGNVGTSAAETAVSLGCDVVVLCHSAASLRRFQARTGGTIRAEVNDAATLAREIREADAVIGAILISTYSTPAMIAEQHVRTMKPGAVIVDATAGYGDGYLPTAGPVQRPGDPARIVHGVGHVKVDVLPSVVPLTATFAYTTNAAPYLLRLARAVLHGGPDPAIESALITEAGRVRHPVLEEHMGYLESGLVR